MNRAEEIANGKHFAIHEFASNKFDWTHENLNEFFTRYHAFTHTFMKR